MAEQWPRPLGVEDWQSWATRLVADLNERFGGITPSDTGRLAEFVRLPSGWLKTDGTAILNASYPALAQVLGTTFGTAPAGQTKLPNIPPVHTGFVMAIKA